MASTILLTTVLLVLLTKKDVIADTGLIKADLGSQEYQSSSKRDVFCVVYNSGFNPLPPSYVGNISTPVANYSFTKGCVDDDYKNISDKVVAVGRGNCTFAEKAAIIQRLRGKAALIIDNANSSYLTPIGGNETDYHNINITVAMMLSHDFVSLMELDSQVKVWLYAPDLPNFDPNMIVMFTLATICVVLGSYWSALLHSKKKSLRRLISKDGKVSEEEEEKKEMEESFSLGMGVAMSVGLVIFFCASLTLLYFFYDYLVYVIITIFCIAGVNGLFFAFLPMWKKLLPCNTRLPPNRLPFLSSEPELRSLALLLLATGFVVAWIIVRHESFAWILQDIIGFCFCLYVMRALLMPSFKACTILLGLLFLYDIFFVFITPLFTKNGESVMIKVATGGDSKSGEQMPTVFKLPYFIPWAMSMCFTDKYSLLGFGDIIIPGLLISYNCAFDLKIHNPLNGRCRFIYFISSIVAYVVGLLLTGIALFLMKSGQPALLYIVPCTILTTVIIAAIRGDLGHMWRGHECPKKNDDVRTAYVKTSESLPVGNVLHADHSEHEEEEVNESQSLLQ